MIKFMLKQNISPNFYFWMVILGILIVLTGTVKSKEYSGYQPVYERANRLISHIPVTSRLLQSRTAQTFEKPKMLPLSESRPIPRMQTNEDPFLKLLAINYSEPVKDKPELLLCSIEDGFSFPAVGIQPRVSRTMEIIQAEPYSQELEKDFFEIDIQEPITIVISSSSKTNQLPLWLEEWNHLEFRMSSQNSDYDFLFQRLSQGGYVLGGNQRLTDEKVYMAFLPGTESETIKPVLNQIGSLNPLNVFSVSLKIKYPDEPKNLLSMEIFDSSMNFIRKIEAGAINSVTKDGIDFWDGYNAAGEPAGNGIYYCKLSSANPNTKTYSFKIVIM